MRRLYITQRCWTLSHVLELDWTIICVLMVREKKKDMYEYLVK